MVDIWNKIGELMLFDGSQPLIFNSGVFLFMFAIFLIGYSILNRATSARIIYVILFSLLFYYKSSGLYFVLLILVAVCDYWIGWRIYEGRERSKKRWLVGASLALNLGLLGYFKYTNMFVELANNCFGEGFLEFQNIFLPVGISFFVFQSLSYTIDIYRGDLRPLDRWGDYLFYLSFFPQLVAGPIVRARDFIPQIRRPLKLSRELFGGALFLILTGLFKKAVIGDYIALNFVDRVFDAPLLYSGGENLMAIYAYALQIYCDFSGYSDMAIGIALMLGFEFPKNFDAPYKSSSITEFWRRWHISLSSWLRDYLYISLGGGRVGRVRGYANLLITMLLGGLWHGASLRFVLWGAMHGVGLILHKMWMAMVPDSRGAVWRIIGGVITFNFVSAGWLFFRADSFDMAWLMARQIAEDTHLWQFGAMIEGYAPIFALMLLGFLLHLLPTAWSEWAKRVVVGSPLVAQVAMCVAMIWLVMQVKSSDIQPFIYFQF